MSARLTAMGLPGWLLLMGALTAIGPISIDMYLPAFPEMAANLGATGSQVERTLAAYLIGMAGAQLIYGPLADRFGRKPPLYGALIVYILASAGCALAPTVEFLTVCRVVQAMGGAAGMVISRAVVRDHYSTQEAARALSMLMLVMGIAPILAPLVGAQVLTLAGWRGIFAVITLAGIALFVAVSRIMVESLPHEKQVALSWRHIFRTYWGLIRHRRFVAFALSGGMGSATMFAYIVASPRLFIEYFGVSPQSYGFIFGFNALSLIVGSQVSARLLKTHRPEKLLPWALLAMMSAGLSALALILIGWITMPLIMLCMMSFMFTQGFVGPNSAAMALSDQGRQLGSASAMMGTITMSCGALAGLTVSLWDMAGPAPLGWIMGGCTTLAFFLGRSARRA